MLNESLAPRLTIEEIVRVYERAVADIKAGYAQIDAAEKTLNEVFVGGHGSISAARHHRISFSDPSDALMEVRHSVWSAVIDRLEVRRMMSIQRAKELDRQLEKHELPEITHRSVAELLQGFQSNLSAMLEEAVEEVFDWLRPRRSEYKTNSEFEVPEKVILGHVVEPWGKYYHRWSINYRIEANLTALENVVSALDGRGQITKTHYSAIGTIIRGSDFDGQGETEYFRFRVFKNGNGHITFKRLDLLARLNQIAGGCRLRPARPLQ